MKPIRTAIKASWISIGSITCVSFLLFLYYQSTPYYGDDLNLGIRWKDYILGHTECFDWGAYLSWLKWQLTDDSFRAFNILIPLFIYLPKVVFNLLTALIFAFTAILTCRVADINLNRPLRVSLVMGALLLCLPWENGMTSIAFTLNYLWELPPVLLSILFLKAPDTHSRTTLAAVGFLAGWGQELAGCAMIGGYAVWWLINRRDFNRRSLYIFLPLAAATLFLVINASFGRYSKHPVYHIAGFDWSRPLEMAVIFITHYFLTSVAALTLIVSLIFTKLRKSVKQLLSGTFPLVFTAMIIATIEGWMLTETGERSQWFPAFFALVAISMLFDAGVPLPLVKNRIAAISIYATINTVIWVNLISGIVWIKRSAKETADITAGYLMREKPDERFYDMETFHNLPLTAYNRMPLSVTRELSLLWSNYCKFYGNGNEPYPIPSRLRHINEASLKKIPGENPFYYYDGWIVERLGDKTASERHFVITYSWGVRRNANFELNEFSADNGHKWNFVMIPFSDSQSRWAKIKSVDIQ